MDTNWTVRVMQSASKGPLSLRDFFFNCKREAVAFANQVKEGHYVGKLDHTYMVYGKA